MQAEAAEAAGQQKKRRAAEEEGDDWSWPFESRSVDLAIRELVPLLSASTAAF